LKQLEQLDRLINRYQQPVFINLMANFFYSKQETGLAVNHFQTLLENQQLHATSCLNLALLHLNSNLPDDALAFLEHVIQLQPDYKPAYVLYIRHTKDPIAKSKMVDQLLKKFPQMRKFTPLQKL
jgi:tetratricopeptide (TPR) repeat protein